MTSPTVLRLIVLAARLSNTPPEKRKPAWKRPLRPARVHRVRRRVTRPIGRSRCEHSYKSLILNDLMIRRFRLMGRRLCVFSDVSYCFRSSERFIGSGLRGAVSRLLSWGRWNGSIGSTTGGSSSRSETYARSSPKGSTIGVCQSSCRLTTVD